MKVRRLPGFIARRPMGGARYVIRSTKHGLVAQAWPRPRTHRPGAYEIDRRITFGLASKFANEFDAIQRQTAENWTRGTIWTWRDMLIAGMYGRAMSIVPPPDSPLWPDRSVNPSAQQVLDQLEPVPGSLIYRGAFLWGTIDPGVDGQVLFLVDGWPVWHDMPPATAPLFAASSRVYGRKTAGAGAAEELTLSEVLDFIGSAAQGDLLIRGAAGWQRLAAGTADNILKSGGAGANPSWAAVSSLTQVSATSRAIGRKSSGAGVQEELTLTELLDFIGGATRGDFLFRGASGWSRLPAGTDGQVLQTRGTTADPVWTNAPSGSGAPGQGGPQPGVYFGAAGTYLTPLTRAQTISIKNMTAGVIYFQPIVVPFNRTMTAITIQCSSALASSKVRLAVYNNRTNGGPGTVLVDGGEVDTATTGTKTATINQAIDPGTYWLALWCSHAIQLRAWSLVDTMAACGWNMGVNPATPINYLTRTVAYGSAYSDESAQTETLSGNVDNPPLIGIR